MKNLLLLLTGITLILVSPDSLRADVLLTCSDGGQNVVRYHADTGAYGGEAVSEPTAMLTLGVDGKAYGTWHGVGEVFRYDPITHQTETFVSAASNGGLDGAVGLDFGPNGDLYVVSSHNGKILRYNGETGAFVDEFATPGSQFGLWGMTFGPDGHLYVGSVGTDSVLKYDVSNGNLMDTFGGGVLDGYLDLTFGADGDLYVAASVSDAVYQYDGETGALVGEFASGNGLDGAYGLTFGPDDNLYVSSRYTDQILRYSGSTGAYIDEFVYDSGLVPTNLLFVVPEPATLSLLALGGLTLLRRRR